MLLLDLLDALRLMPDLRRFILFKCTAVWDGDDVFPSAPAPISMNRLEEFAIRTESPVHFVMHLAIPDAARKRLAVLALEAPGCDSCTTRLEALPQLCATHTGTRGGLQP